MRTNSFEREKRKFRNLVRRVNHLIINKEWEDLPDTTRNYLISKINSLLIKLSRFFSSSELRKILAAAVMLIAIPLVSKSQAFGPPLQNPFGYIPPQSQFATPTFADIDNDEDIDLFLGDYEGNIHFYENTGTNTTPVFASDQINPFGLSSTGYLAFLTCADIDDDGDVDFFAGGYNGIIYFFENTGTAADPAFNTPQQNPFGLVPASNFAIPGFTDIDNDGDLDLFVGEYEGNMKFYENTGTNNLPHFAAPELNPFGINAANYVGAPAFADLDNDGDPDLYEGEMYGNTRYFENTGTPQSPVFATPVNNPFGIVQTNYYSFPAFADLDSDGDLDLMIGELYGSLQYFENTDINIGVQETSTDEFFKIFPNPATDNVTISLHEKNPGYPMEIILSNSQGKIVKTGIIKDQQAEIRTEGLSPGAYIVKLIGHDKTYSGKLIIK
jgi:hypothetical protein